MKDIFARYRILDWQVFSFSTLKIFSTELPYAEFRSKKFTIFLICSSVAATPGLLPGKSHGRRSLVGCSPWGCWGLDTTERLHFHFSLSCIGEGNGNPLQCSCLENPTVGGAWWAAICGVTQSRTWLKRLSDLAVAAAAFKVFPLLSVLRNLIIIYPGVVFFMFLVLAVCWATSWNLLSSNLKTFQWLLFQIFFLFFLFFSFYWTSSITSILGWFKLSCTLFFLFKNSFFSLCFILNCSSLDG